MAFSISTFGDDGSKATAIITSLAVSLLIFLYYALNVIKSKKAYAEQPPGPRGLPLVGYLPFLGTDLHKTFAELAQVYGPIFKLRLGSKLCVAVSSPSLVKEVLRDQDVTFADRDQPIAGLVSSSGGNDIAFNSYGPEWKKLRKIFVSHLMSKASLDGSYSLRREEVKKSIRDVYDNKIGKPIDIGEFAISTLVRVMQNLLWGGSVELGEKGSNLGAELKEKLAESMILMGVPNISDFFPLLARFDIQGIERRGKKTSLWFQNVINTAVEKYRRSQLTGGNQQRKDLLKMLLELKENGDSATSISMTQFQGLLVDILTGGTDTATTTVEWTMAELTRNPQAMKKLQEELAQVVGMDSCVEEFYFPKLKYLHAVVKESMRLHPALPLLVPRRSRESSSVGGYAIPKGTTLMVNVWAIHRDPQLWDDPLEFKPERFLNDAAKFDFSGNNFQYLPFGSGRRMCPGISLAERMVMLILASLVHCFDWKLPAGTDLELPEKFGIVIKIKEPLIAIPTPRLPISELYQ